MRFLLCLSCTLLLGCASDQDVKAINPEVKESAEQLSQILTASRSSLESQVATLDAITVQSSVLESIAARLDVLIEIQQPLGVEVETKEVPASTKAVVVEASEPVSGKEVIQQSTSTSSSDTVADDDVRFEEWTADWCIKCRTQKPILKAVANELGIPEPRELIWEKHKKYAYLYNIDGLPVVSIIRRGRSQKVLHGVQSREALIAAVAEVRALQLTPDGNVTTMASSDDLTIRNKLPVVNTRWGLHDLEEVNADGTCQCERCVELRALKSAYLAKPEYQNIGRKVEPETF